MDIKGLPGAEIGNIALPQAPGSKEAQAPGKSFSQILEDSLAEVDNLQKKADAAITSLAKGENVSVHETMIAMEQADVSFQLMMQVRNKIVEAYREILRIQV